MYGQYFCVIKLSFKRYTLDFPSTKPFICFSQMTWKHNITDNRQRSKNATPFHKPIEKIRLYVNNDTKGL